MITKKNTYNSNVFYLKGLENKTKTTIIFLKKDSYLGEI